MKKPLILLSLLLSSCFSFRGDHYEFKNTPEGMTKKIDISSEVEHSKYTINDRCKDTDGFRSLSTALDVSGENVEQSEIWIDENDSLLERIEYSNYDKWFSFSLKQAGCAHPGASMIVYTDSDFDFSDLNASVLDGFKYFDFLVMDKVLVKNYKDLFKQIKKEYLKNDNAVDSKKCKLENERIYCSSGDGFFSYTFIIQKMKNSKHQIKVKYFMTL